MGARPPPTLSDALAGKEFSEGGPPGLSGSVASYDTPKGPQYLPPRKANNERLWLFVRLQRFNRKAKRGLSFLQSQGLLGTAASDVAKFFHDDDRVDKTQLGDFLGDPDPFNKEVRGRRPS